ncbi:MAG: hypothetical protein CMD20_03460, partial [Flavobacteriales bacterium]|nr:hypothetical protein [Flavobacteriales bacterium]
SAGACGRASIDVASRCGVGLNEVLGSEISVYPNPANDVVNIYLGSINAKNSTIELYSSVGQLVMSKNILSASGNQTQFETTELDGGLYFIKVLTEGKVYATSVVITK